MDNLTLTGVMEAPAFPAACPIQLDAAMPTRLFDATCGLVHYFVRPDDEFVLNTLELLDTDAYLYRVLRAEDYRRVALVEVGSTDCWVKVYDTPSELLFRQVASGEKKGPQTMFYQPALDEPVPADRPAMGWRQVTPFCDAKEFSKKFTVEISAALENVSQPTAIVMPLSIFEKSGYFEDKIVDTVARIEKMGNRGNILLLTMSQRSDLKRCFNGEQPRLHPWTNAILVRQQAEALDQVQEAVRELSNLGLLVLADEYQTDEIANLLLRKKHLLGVPGLADLPDRTVYPLAVQLREHCAMIRNHRFTRIPYRDWTKNCIRSLNTFLDRPEVQRELTQRAEGLQARKTRTACSAQLSPLLLERTYHLHLRRYEDGSTVDEILAEFDQYVGNEMQEVKSEVLRAARSFQKQRQRAPRPENAPFMNLVFSGPPGTGKTTIARLTARLFHAMGLLPADTTMETSARELSASHIGETNERVQAAFRKADGGVLFIDEFHGFYNAHEHGNVADEAMGAIVAGINGHRGSLCVIVAGYEAEVRRVFECDKGAAERFPVKIRFRAYSTDTMLEILRTLAAKWDMGLDGEAEALLRRVLDSDRDMMGEEHGNGRNVENLLNKLDDVHDAGDSYTREDVLRAFPDRAQALSIRQNPDEILQEFDRYSGEQMRCIPDKIKEAADYFESELNYLRRRREAGEELKPDDFPYLNLRFLGPPGTGKTTAARLAARYFAARGILPHAATREVESPTLIQGTVGETAKRIREEAKAAKGGVLFIDEFQSLDIPFTGGNLAAEAMHALVGAVNEFCGSLCIIVAGYEDDVKRIFKYERGSDRRFQDIHFQNYDLPTLMAIFDSLIRARGIEIEPGARALLERAIRRVMARTDRTFGNAGDMNEIFRKSLEQRRCARDKGDLVYREADVLAAFPETEAAEN